MECPNQTLRADCAARLGCASSLVYGAETRSASRGTLVFVNEPTQPVASVHPAWWRISPTLDRWPTIGRREFQAPMRSMIVVMLDELRQDPLKMPSAANQQPV